MNRLSVSPNVLFLATELVGKNAPAQVWRSALTALERVFPGVVFAFCERQEDGSYEVHAKQSLASAPVLEALSRHTVAPRLAVREASVNADLVALLALPVSVASPERRLVCIAWALPGAVSVSAAELSAMGELLERSLVAAYEVEVLRKESAVDPLTGLNNRRAILDALEREEARVARHGGALSVVYVDVDQFKSVNDLYGHAVGDLALRFIADTLRDAVRANDTVGRIGGDEFLLVLPDTSRREAQWLMRRLGTAVRERWRVEGHAELPLSVTLGLASASEASLGSGAATSLLELADKRMLAKKRRSRATVSVA